MTDGEQVGGHYAETMAIGGFIFWGRNPRRKIDEHGFDVATDTEGNCVIAFAPEDALMMLEYLQKHKSMFEKQAIDRALGQWKNQWMEP